MIKLERVPNEFANEAVGIKITAPIYWWDKFFGGYGINLVHYRTESLKEKIEAKRFVMNQDFSIENLKGTNEEMFKVLVMLLNETRDQYLKEKDVDSWLQIMQLLPKSYNVTRTVFIPYYVFPQIYYNMKDSPYPEWRAFCNWIKEIKVPMVEWY